MPTYEYSCSNCGHSLEAYQSMKDVTLSACPACGRPALRRLSARGAGALFRGNGFFQGAAAGRGASPDAGSPGLPPPAAS